MWRGRKRVTRVVKKLGRAVGTILSSSESGAARHVVSGSLESTLTHRGWGQFVTSREIDRPCRDPRKSAPLQSARTAAKINASYRVCLVKTPSAAKIVAFPAYPSSLSHPATNGSSAVASPTANISN